MKKSNYIMGIIYLLIGIIFMILALLVNTKLGSLFFGFAGACTGIGVMMISRYIYWNSPKNSERYIEKLENEKIEKNDELKEKVRGKSAQYTYAIGLYITSFSTVIFSVLDSLEIIENGNIFVFYLVGYLIFQLVIGVVIFNHIMKKY